MYILTIRAPNVQDVSAVMNVLADRQAPHLEINVRAAEPPPAQGNAPLGALPAPAGPRAAVPREDRVVKPFLARQVFDGEGECPICFDKIRNFSGYCLLRCGHAFHKSCYERSEAPCAVCRD